VSARATLATRAAKAAGIAFSVHEYAHDAGAASYGLEAAELLGLDPQRVFKTLVTELDDGDMAVALVPASTELDLKGLAAAAAVKKAAMADPRAAERRTGYVVGAISPLGQRRRLRTVVDRSALDFDTVFVSAGRRGLELEPAPGDLVRLTEATVAAIAR